MSWKLSFIHPGIYWNLISLLLYEPCSSVLLSQPSHLFPFEGSSLVLYSHHSLLTCSPLKAPH